MQTRFLLLFLTIVAEMQAFWPFNCCRRRSPRYELVDSAVDMQAMVNTLVNTTEPAQFIGFRNLEAHRRVGFYQIRTLGKNGMSYGA